MAKTKRCTGCDKRKYLGAFTKRKASKDGLSFRCRTCTRRAVKSHYDRNVSYYRKKQLGRKRAAKLEFDRIIAGRKNVPCLACGRRFPACGMDFDHVRGEKRFCIGEAISYTTVVSVLLEEIAKCEVICAVCHRIRTHGDDL